MPCNEERISTFMDGELPESEARRVREHLADCDSCRETLEAFLWIESLALRAHWSHFAR